MASFGLVGPTYTGQAVNTDAQRCINWYPEPNESGAGKSKVTLLPTGGSKTFANLPENSIPGEFTINGRAFVAASQLYELFSDGTFNAIHSLATFANSASMSASQTQLVITTGGRVFVYGLQDGSFAEATGLQGPVVKARYIDGLFIAILQDSNKFQISNLGDGTVWDPLDIFEIEGFPENLVSLEVDHEQVAFFGQKHSVIYFDSGDPNNPYQPVPGGFVEQGCAAGQSVTKLDNSYFWIGADDRGQGIAWRMNGYTPQRVSNFSIETEWASYSTLADAVGYGFQDKGHSFWQIYFPSANKTWVYDAATGMWCERAYFSNGSYSAHRSQCHMFVFGKHLVGDWNSGTIFDMSTNYPDDAGQVIRRERDAPYIAKGNQRLRHSSLWVDLEMGLGPIPALKDGFGFDRDPIAMLSWSDTSAKTWSNEHFGGAGKAGQYKKRMMFRRLGQSKFHGRVYRLVVSDPIPWRVTDADVEVS